MNQILEIEHFWNAALIGSSVFPAKVSNGYMIFETNTDNDMLANIHYLKM